MFLYNTKIKYKKTSVEVTFLKTNTIITTTNPTTTANVKFSNTATKKTQFVILKFLKIIVSTEPLNQSS